MKKQDHAPWAIQSRLFFTKNSELIAEHELKKRHKYAKYTIDYGVGKDRKTKTFSTKKEAMAWIKKNKVYFHPTAVYMKRKIEGLCT